MKKFAFPLQKAADWYRQRLSSEEAILQSILVEIHDLDRQTESLRTSLRSEHEQMQDAKICIGYDLDPDHLRYASANQMASLASSSAYWIFGLAHYDSPATGEAVRSIFLRKTDPEAFLCPEQERTILFFWSDGQAHRADGTYRLSSRRTAWTRFAVDVRHSDLLEVGFSLGRLGDISRVSGVTLRLNRPGNPVRVIRELLIQLQTFGPEPLKGTQTLYLVTDNPGLVAPVRDVRDFTGVVQVDSLFAHLPAEEPCPC